MPIENNEDNDKEVSQEEQSMEDEDNIDALMDK